jgi:nicotinic acid mononucleotide adenylyltransferase
MVAIVSKRKKEILIGIFGGSFNPPGLHHLKISQKLLETVENLVIIPSGERDDKAPTTCDLSPQQRGEIIKLAFKELACQITYTQDETLSILKDKVSKKDHSSKVILDLSDINQKKYTRSYNLVKNYSFSTYKQKLIKPWLIVGGDIIFQDQIRSTWYRGEDLWHETGFVIITRGSAYSIDKETLPPRYILLPDAFDGSSSEIRRRIQGGEDFSQLVTKEVFEFFKHHTNVFHSSI